MRRQRREGLDMNAREYYRKILRERIKDAAILNKLQMNISRSKQTKLIKRQTESQMGFNPFNQLLSDLRKKKDDEPGDMLDKQFEDNIMTNKTRVSVGVNKNGTLKKFEH